MDPTPTPTFHLSPPDYTSEAHLTMNLHSKRQQQQQHPISPGSTPETNLPIPPTPCCPSCPQHTHIYTPPTLQHYVLPDMPMPDINPYSMDRMHLHSPDLDNLLYGNAPSPYDYDYDYSDSPPPTSLHPILDITTNTTPIPIPNTSTPDYLLQPSDWIRTTADYYNNTTTSSHAQAQQAQAPSYIPQRTTSAVALASASMTSTPPAQAQTPLSHPYPSSNNSQKDLTNYGIRNADQTWRCAYPGCSSSTIFRRGCDLRKHYNRHRKHLFCRHGGCPQAVAGGFSSKKDRDRHEAKHNPLVACEWEGCRRMFSRVDNMKDHVRRIHRRGS
ncbi:putative C2H2 transcription factor [Aspergillus alliaceus]|uniref:putative C2H2 transcription factor n=1 Tax=Petromyces alliaceus TaxID=209559 RepID=UPI0012A56F3A|nr:uncharacterized protein BDW43DRAFT_275566 [Aspergillus alliaceus]KAB8233593.1 hypothetical protein BDW43DRAFT_275566 [Aspergillus alliaceus]